MEEMEEMEEVEEEEEEVEEVEDTCSQLRPQTRDRSQTISS